MVLGNFLRVIKARFGLVMLIFLTTLVTTIVVSLLLPKKYSVSTALVVDMKGTDPVLGGAVMSTQTVQGYLATQVDIVKSDRVVQKVISRLRIDSDPGWIQRWNDEGSGLGDIKTFIADTLFKKLDVSASREGTTLIITYEGNDPRFTTDVVNAFAQAYIDTTVELKTEPAKNFKSWFEAQTKTYREELERAQSRLSAAQQASGIVASDERYDVENSRLSELSNQLVQVQASLAESRSRQGAVSRGGRDSMPEVVQNPLIQTLKAEVGRAEAKVQQLGSRLGAAHPELVSAQYELNALKSRLESEISKVTGSITASNSVNVQREADLRASLEAQRTKVLKLKQSRDQLAVFQREVDSAQKSLELVSQRLTETNLESQTRQSNISVLTPAIVPAEATRPKPLLNAIIGAIAGLFIGTLAALTLEGMQKPLRTSDDLLASAGVPVLAVLPPAGSRRPPRLIGSSGPTMRPPQLRLGN